MKTFRLSGLIGLILLLTLTACAGVGQAAPAETMHVAKSTCGTPQSGTPAACKLNTMSTAPSANVPVDNTPTAFVPTPVPPTLTAAPTADTNLTRNDSQGNVSVDVTPLDLTHPGDSLVFQIAMNTHSVDLSMDLVKLAILMTDTGKTLKPTTWDAPRGGHHVTGKLSFPMKDLSGTKQITLTIKNVDAPSRVFTWSLDQ